MTINKTIKHSYIYILGSGLQALAPFILIPVITRNSSQATFGLLMSTIAIGTILSFAFSLGIPAVLTRDLIFEKDNSKEYKNLSSKFQSVLFWLSLLLILINQLFMSNSNFKLFFFGISIALSLSIIQIKLSILRAEFKSVIFAMLAVSSTGLPLLAVSAATLNSINNLLFVYAFVLISITFILQFKDLFNVPRKIDLVAINKIIVVGSPMIIHSVAISMFQYGDKLAGYFGLGSELAAEIAVLSLIMTLPMLLLSTINNAWLPSVLEQFHKNNESGFNYSNRISIRLSLLITLFSLAIITFSKLIVQTLAPTNYDLLGIQKAIVIGVCLSPLYVLYLQNTHLITKDKKFKSLAKITPLAALTQFVFTFILVKQIGLISVAYGLIIAILIQVALTSVAAGSFNKLNKSPIYLTIVLSGASIIYLNLFL